MGVGLYKNKYLCIREIYQNALDACRCSQAYYSNQKVDAKGVIEFGLEECEIDGSKKKYFYCLDNGTGMTKEIIESFFLKIGNSYYKSKEFSRKSVKWNKNFKPTSQFGIGILSCFMLGDKIEVTSKYIEVNKDSNAIRFAIEGPHERVYYMTPDELDIEKIGRHGTLIKIFLSSNVSLNNNFDDIDKIPGLIYFGSKYHHLNDQAMDLYDSFYGNLFYILTNAIGKTDVDININVRLANNVLEPLIDWNNPIIPGKCLDLVDSNLREKYKKGLDYIEFLDVVPIAVKKHGIEYYTSLILPKPGFNSINLIDFTSYDLIKSSSREILIDGISVKRELGKFELVSSDLFERGIFNFVGDIRPQLSVDRNFITDIPQEIHLNIKDVTSEVVKQIMDKFSIHVEKYGIDKNSQELRIIWESILYKFHSISHMFCRNIKEFPMVDVVLADLEPFLGKSVTALEFITMETIRLNGYNSRYLTQLSLCLLILKMCKAKRIEVIDNNILIETTDYVEINDVHGDIAIMPDIWEGKFSQYDVVASLWPLINPKLFEKINARIRSHKKISDRAIESSSWLESSATFNPFTLIGGVDFTWELKQEVLTWNIDLQDTTKNYLIFVFVDPYDSTVINNLKEIRNYDRLQEGFSNGWSILIVSELDHIIVENGILDRKSCITGVQDFFLKSKSHKEFSFTDDIAVKSIFS